MSRWILMGFITLSSAVFAAPRSHTFDKAPASYDVRWLEQSRDESEVEITIHHFTTSELMIEGNLFHAVDLPDAQHLDDFMYPALPKIYRDFAIPFGAVVSVSVISEDLVHMPLEPIVPSKGSLFRSQNPSDVPFIFGPYYQHGFSGNPLWPETEVSVSESYQFRDVTGARLMWHPFRYDRDKQELLIAKSVRLKISHKAPVLEEKHSLNGFFLPYYQRHFPNLSAIWGHSPRSRDLPEVLVIGTPAACDYYATHRDILSMGARAWHEDCGAAERTSDDIMAAVRASYLAYPKLTHVLLLGDETFVPFFPGITGNASENEADPMYGMLTEDRYPELIVSRLPFNTLDQLAVTLARDRAYLHGAISEKPSVLQIASNEFYMPGTPRDWERISRYDALYPQATTTHLFDPDLSTNSVIGALEKGPTLVNYMGHGAIDGWYSGNYFNENVNTTHNTAYPIIHSVACINGEFAFPFYESFAEHMLNHGTIEKPEGALAILASSTNQTWIPPTVGQLEANRAYAAGDVHNVGDLMMYTWLGVLEDGSPDAWQTVETWLLFGDALLPVRALPGVH